MASVSVVYTAETLAKETASCYFKIRLNIFTPFSENNLEKTFQNEIFISWKIYSYAFQVNLPGLFLSSVEIFFLDSTYLYLLFHWPTSLPCCNLGIQTITVIISHSLLERYCWVVALYYWSEIWTCYRESDKVSGGIQSYFLLAEALAHRNIHISAY